MGKRQQLSEGITVSCRNHEGGLWPEITALVHRNEGREPAGKLVLLAEVNDTLLEVHVVVLAITVIEVLNDFACGEGMYEVGLGAASYTRAFPDRYVDYHVLIMPARLRSSNDDHIGCDEVLMFQ